MDVVRVLAAVLLLGNVQFNESTSTSLIDDPIDGKTNGNSEIKAAAALLGVSSVSLYRGLTTRIHSIRGQILKSHRDSFSVCQSFDAQFNIWLLISYL